MCMWVLVWGRYAAQERHALCVPHIPSAGLQDVQALAAQRRRKHAEAQYGALNAKHDIAKAQQCHLNALA